MKPPIEGWNEAYWTVISTVFDMEKSTVDRELMAELRQGQLSTSAYQTEYLHRVWERVANLLGMDYTRSEKENDVSET